MNNRLIAIVLLLALISSNLSGLLVYIEFKANQKYIAVTLCENRDKPLLECNGQCYLIKKLKDSDEKERKQERTTQKKGAYDVFIISAPLVIVFEKPTPGKEEPAADAFQLPQFCSEILHPPPAGFTLS